MKRLAMAGLMLQRLGITMDGNGAINGLADRFMAEPARQPPKVKAQPARPIPASQTMSMSKPLGI